MVMQLMMRAVSQQQPAEAAAIRVTHQAALTIDTWVSDSLESTAAANAHAPPCMHRVAVQVSALSRRPNLQFSHLLRTLLCFCMMGKIQSIKFLLMPAQAITYTHLTYTTRTATHGQGGR